MGFQQKSRWGEWRGGFQMKKKGFSKRKEVFSKRKSRRRGEWPEGFSDAGGKLFSALNSWWENAPAEAAPIHSSISIFSYFLFFGNI